MEASLNQNLYSLKRLRRKNLTTKRQKRWLKERLNCKLNEMQCSRRRKRKGKSNSNKKSKDPQQTHIQTSDSKSLKKSTQKQRQSKLKNSSRRKRKISKETKTTPLKKSHERRKGAKIWNQSLELPHLRSNPRKYTTRKIKVRNEKMFSAR